MPKRNLLLFSGLLLSSALATTPPAPAPTQPNPEVAMRDFLRAYWDPQLRYFLGWNKTAPFKRFAGAGPKGGAYSDFWWEAQLWDLVLDAYERTVREGNPSFLYRKLIDDVYDGFVGQYPDWYNDFNDDLGWWAQAAMRAYQLTGNKRYLERAETLFAGIWKYWTPAFGGGVLWRRSGDSQKNVATNGPLAVTAVRLYQATGDASYLEKAKQLWNWVNEKLTNGNDRVYDNLVGAGEGELRQWDFTYNFGNFILASLALNEVAPDKEYLERSVKAADWTFENLTLGGVLLDEGSGDGGGFRGVFLRALRRLADAPGLSEADRARFNAALNDNATQVWNARRADGLLDTNWNLSARAGAFESMAVGSGIAALQLAPGPFTARIVFGDGRYEAENSFRAGLNHVTAAPGYSGRGYLNNFHEFGQYVRFDVKAPAAGRYTVKIRYSAGGGAAARTLLLGEDVAAQLSFPATPDWRTWDDETLTLELPLGPSSLTLRFDQGSGKGWLNVDKLTLEGPVAEAAP